MKIRARVLVFFLASVLTISHAGAAPTRRADPGDAFATFVQRLIRQVRTKTPITSPRTPKTNSDNPLPPRPTCPNGQATC